MRQNRETQNKFTYIWLIYDKGAKIIFGQMEVFNQNFSPGPDTDMHIRVCLHINGMFTMAELQVQSRVESSSYSLLPFIPGM